MTQKELFSEFMTLYYEPGIRCYNFTDILIKAPYIIVRLDGVECKVIYLHNGMKISIPWKWIDTFRSYNTGYGHRALEIGLSDKNTSNIDHLIYNFLKLMIYLDNRKGDEFLSTLYRICQIGTSEFIKMSLDEFGEKYSPMSFDNLDKHLTI